MPTSFAPLLLTRTDDVPAATGQTSSPPTQAGAPPPPPPSQTSNSSFPVVPVVSGVLGGVVLILVIVIIVLVSRRRRQRRQDRDQEKNAASMNATTMGGMNASYQTQMPSFMPTHNTSPIPPNVYTESPEAFNAGTANGRDRAAKTANVVQVVVTSEKGLDLPPGYDRVMGSLHVVTLEFFPELPDELELHEGDQVVLNQTFEDGWGRGSNLTTLKNGIFPIMCLSETALVDKLVTENSLSTYSASFNSTSSLLRPSQAPPSPSPSTSTYPPPSPSRERIALAPPVIDTSSKTKRPQRSASRSGKAGKKLRATAEAVAASSEAALQEAAARDPVRHNNSVLSEFRSLDAQLLGGKVTINDYFAKRDGIVKRLAREGRAVEVAWGLK